MVGNEAAGGTDGVQEEKEVETVFVRHGRLNLRRGEGSQEVKGEVNAEEEEERANGIEGILKGTKSGPVDEGTGFAGRDALS